VVRGATQHCLDSGRQRRQLSAIDFKMLADLRLLTTSMFAAFLLAR